VKALKYLWAVLAMCLVAAPVRAFTGPGPQGPPMFSSNCAGSPQFGSAVVCYDTTLHTWMFWTGTVFSSSNRTIMSVNAGAGATTAVTTFFFPLGTPTSATTEAVTMEMSVPLGGTLRNLNCSDSVAPGASKSDTFTVRSSATLGGTMASSTVTCAISGASATNCTDSTHTLAVPIGGVIDIQDVTASTPTARTIGCSYEMDF
jgi:hypothetical protein